MRRSSPIKTSRIQVDLTPNAKEQLQKLRDSTEAASYSEVIRRALQLYQRVMDEQANGRFVGTLVEVGDGHEFREILVLT